MKKAQHNDDLQTTMLMKRADQLFSTLIKERDNYQCRVCKTAGTDCSHIISRNVLNLRYDEQNALTLCRTCHRLLHDYPRESSAVIDKICGDGHFEMLFRQSKQKLMHGSKKEYLKSIIAELESKVEHSTPVLLAELGQGEEKQGESGQNTPLEENHAQNQNKR